MQEEIKDWDYVPANSNILGRRINRGEVVNLYGTNAPIYGIRRHKQPGGQEDRDFVYYMVSCDPGKLAWYHVSKKESTLKEPIPAHVPGRVEKFLNKLFGYTN